MLAGRSPYESSSVFGNGKQLKSKMRISADCSQGSLKQNNDGERKEKFISNKIAYL